MHSGFKRGLENMKNLNKESILKMLNLLKTDQLTKMDLICLKDFGLTYQETIEKLKKDLSHGN